MDLGRRGAAILFGAAAATYLVDRSTKLWADRALSGRPPITVIPGILDLRFTTNSGGAFSIGQSAPWIFAGATIVASVAIAATAFRHTGAVTPLALGMILGGALGNLTDRIARGPGLSGRVVDFIDFHVWPVFNLADAAITVAAVLLVVSSVRRREAGAN